MQMRQFHKVGKWTLIPRSEERAQPDYIPAKARMAYNQACVTLKVSPRASAALSRSCLQIMIRDFWSLTPAHQKTLESELNRITPKLTPETLASIDAVRKFGQIDSYLQEDVDLMVNASELEARLLIALVEVLFEDWYVDRRRRQGRADTLQEIISKLEGELPKLEADLPKKLTKVTTLREPEAKKRLPRKKIRTSKPAGPRPSLLVLSRALTVNTHFRSSALY